MSNLQKKSEFHKPDIKFPMFPLVYAYIESAYIKVKTYQDFTAFIHGCMNEAEVSKNSVRKAAYTTIANALYSVETNVSFESKGLEILIQKL
jgi:hypothetical protein